MHKRQFKCDPIIMYANFSEFKAGNNKKSSGKIESRLLLWCLSGSGYIIINDEKIKLLPDICILTPWNFTYNFVVDDTSLCCVAAVHIIPNMKKGSVFDSKVFVSSNKKQKHHKLRTNFSIPNLSNKLIQFNIKYHDEINYIVKYIIQRFSSREQSRTSLEQLACLLIEEIIFHQMKHKSNKYMNYPAKLRRILILIDWKYNKNLKIKDLIESGNCSRSTLFLLFKQYLNTTPTIWIIEKKLEHSIGLLMSTTLTVQEIAFTSGFETPNYFSKIFKNKYNETPIEYRNKIVKNP